MPESDATETLEYWGEQLSLCIDTTYEFTEAQRECVRRFAFPSEERPEPLWPWQLPKKLSSSQVLTFQRFSVSLGGTAVVRGLGPERAESEAMLVLSMRP